MPACIVWQDGQFIPTADAPESCPGYLLLTNSEWQQNQPLMQPLTVAEGVAVSTAIIGVWALAFTFRVVRKQLDFQTGDTQ